MLNVLYGLVICLVFGALVAVCIVLVLPCLCPRKARACRWTPPDDDDDEAIPPAGSDVDIVVGPHACGGQPVDL